MQFEVVPFEEYNTRIGTGEFEAVLIDMISGPTSGGRIFSGARRSKFKGLQRLRLRERRSRTAVRACCARRPTKPPCGRQPAGCSGCCSTIRPRSSWPGTSAPGRAARLQVVRRSRTAIPCLTHLALDADDRSTPAADAVKKISTRFALLMAAAAVVPLLAYGAVSIFSLRTGAQQAVIARQPERRPAGGRADRAVRHQQRQDPEGVAADLQQTGLERWQQDRILKNFVLEFPEFTRADAARRERAADRLEPPRTADRRAFPGSDSVNIDGALMSRFSVDDDLLPTAVVAVRLDDTQDGGWLVGRLSLEELWRMVDRIRVGEQRLRAGRHRRRPAARARRPRREVARRARRQLARRIRCRRSCATTASGRRSRVGAVRRRARRRCSASASRLPDARLDGHRRAAGRGSVRHSDPRCSGSWSSPSRVALLAMLARRLLLGPQLHRSDPRA